MGLYSGFGVGYGLSFGNGLVWLQRCTIRWPFLAALALKITENQNSKHWKGKGVYKDFHSPKNIYYSGGSMLWVFGWLKRARGADGEMQDSMISNPPRHHPSDELLIASVKGGAHIQRSAENYRNAPAPFFHNFTHFNYENWQGQGQDQSEGPGSREYDCASICVGTHGLITGGAAILSTSQAWRHERATLRICWTPDNLFL